MQQITIDVREFAVPTPRKGSIEPGSGYGFANQTTLGQEIHKSVQQHRKGMYENYRAEVKITHKFLSKDLCVSVGGRIDGLFEPTSHHANGSVNADRQTAPKGASAELSTGDGDEFETSWIGRALSNPGAGSYGGAEQVYPREETQLTLFRASFATEADTRSADRPHIEEIKAAFSAAKLARILESDPWHPYCLQLKTYGYMLWKQNGGLKPSLSFHVVSIFGRQTIEVKVPFDIEIYEQWLERRLASLIEKEKVSSFEFHRRKKIATQLSLPFEEARVGQLELMQNIERGLGTGSAIVVQAPTGLGKTMAVMLPALQNAMQRGQRLIYTTPKNSIHTVAEDAVQQLRQANTAIKSLTLSAKSKMCMLAEQVCDPKVCEFARDYYTKLSQGDVVNKVSNNQEMTPALFRSYAETYKVCPFELSIDCISRADVVICDYNHVFAPISLSGRLTEAAFQKNEKPNLIIDEAHNLHTRATGYFSSVVSTEMLRSLRFDFLKFYPHEVNLLDRAVQLLEEIARTIPGKESSVQLTTKEFFRTKDLILAALYRCLESLPDPQHAQPILSLWRDWSNFCTSLEHQGKDKFSTCKKESGNITLKTVCCDASDHLREQYEHFENVIAFSATLKPFDYYCQLSGFDKDAMMLFEATSPFPTENRKLLIIPQVSTKYRDRDRNYHKICATIERISALKHANYLLFFPSFDFLEQISNRLSAPGFKMLIQKRSMTTEQIDSYLEELRNSEGNLLFAVQGGVFSEGVDFKGSMASGAFIVGPGLPGYDLERELLREYYEKEYGNGFDYAYTYPAMTKVIQSAGRVVRSPDDCGLIVLLDGRFLIPSYAQSMPIDWYNESPSELVSTSILDDVSKFWQGHSGATN